MTEHQFLPVIDGEAPNWPRQVAQAQQAGANFLMILPEHNGVMGEFCQAFQLAPERLPTPLRKSSLFLLSPHIQPEAFDRLLLAMENKSKVIFLEQLDLPITRPPQVERYLVYCDIWGILSQHADAQDARQSCSDYINGVNVQRPHPEPGIYKWDGASWHSLEE